MPHCFLLFCSSAACAVLISAFVFYFCFCTLCCCNILVCLCLLIVVLLIVVLLFAMLLVLLWESCWSVHPKSDLRWYSFLDKFYPVALLFCFFVQFFISFSLIAVFSPIHRNRSAASYTAFKLSYCFICGCKCTFIFALYCFWFPFMLYYSLFIINNFLHWLCCWSS